MASDPMDAIKKLCEHLEKVAKDTGLDLHTFAVLPNMEGGPHMVQAMFIFDDSNNSLAARHAAAVAGQTEKDTPEHERIEDPDEAAKTNAMFDEMMKGQQKTEEELQMEEAGRRAQQMAEDLMKGNLSGSDEQEAS